MEQVRTHMQRNIENIGAGVRPACQSLQSCKQIRALFNLEHCAMQCQAGNRKMRWHFSAKAAFKMIQEMADDGTEIRRYSRCSVTRSPDTVSCC
jgi:hypothetical protein